jgi:hypothetical protein
MSFADTPTKPIRGIGYDNHVHVIRHQTISPHLYTAARAPMGHQLQVGFIILVAEERLLPTITPLRDMMRKPSSYNPCNPRHARTIIRRPPVSRNRYGVPRFPRNRYGVPRFKIGTSGRPDRHESRRKRPFSLESSFPWGVIAA